MNYIQLINNIWQLRRSKHLSSVQFDLYMCIVHESNTRGWENPMRITNGLICASIGITEKTLIDARNRLQQLGVISFENGITKRQSPTYYILEYWKNYSIDDSIDASIPGGNQGGIAVYINNKLNKSKTKQSSEAKASAPRDQVAKKKKKKAAAGEGLEYWQQLVAIWFDFYENVHPKKGEQPTFSNREPKSLHEIVLLLKKRSDARNMAWTEEHAKEKLKNFLTHASTVVWIKDNFLLHNMQLQFDKIVNQHSDGTRHKDSTGGGNSGRNDAPENIIQPGSGFFG